VRKVTLLIAILFIAIGITIGFSINATAQQPHIPSWIKNTAKWWGDGQISDDEFIKAIQWLVTQGIIVIPNNQSTSQTTVPSSSAQQTQTVGKSLTDLLPTRDDIGTLWIVKNYVIVNGNGTDYKDKITQEFTKDDGGISTVLAVNIYNYESSAGAQQHYDSRISAIKSQGGYQEISGLDSNCYGTTESLALTNRISVYCVKDNYYIVSSGLSVSLDLQDNVTKFAKAVLGKIG